MQKRMLSKDWERLPTGESVIYQGDALDFPEQIGLEPMLSQFLNRLVGVFAEVRRILKKEGVFWLNIGDSYTSGNRGWRAPDKKNRVKKDLRAKDVGLYIF